jgi:hypothetical protein
MSTRVADLFKKAGGEDDDRKAQMQYTRYVRMAFSFSFHGMVPILDLPLTRILVV